MEKERIESELAAIVRDHAKPTAPEKKTAVSVNGHHNVVVIGAGEVVIGPSSTPAEISKPKDRGKKTTWRQELQDEIMRRVWYLGMNSEQCFELAAVTLRRPVSGLDQISGRDLGILYETLMALRRPALE